MSSRKIDELASDIDDAKRALEELRDAPDVRVDKLDELDASLENANDAIEELEDSDPPSGE